MKKTIVAVALVLIFVLALAAPAFAMVHVGVAKVNGSIWSNKQVGHLCNTGMEQTKTIRGTGELTNDWNIAMVKGKATVVDKNDFVSAAGTAAPLVITSEIRLCTPPKYMYKLGTLEAPVGMTSIYTPAAAGTEAPFAGAMPATWNANTGAFVGTNVKWLASAGGWKPLTSQTWAARVKADAGFSGKLYQDFEAAYGAYRAGPVLGADDSYPVDAKSTWNWGLNADGAVVPRLGATFVGDYFKMSQTARTSMGKVDRYIDISSPWSGAYLYEDSEMTGFVEIVETFNMTNLPGGADVPGKWWTGLFTKR